MSVTEIIALGGLFATVAGFIINNLVSLGKRIRELEKDLSAEKARSITEDLHHNSIISELKADIASMNNKLDSILKVIKS